MKTVAGLFDDHGSAERAAQALIAGGFDRSDLSMVATEAAREASQTEQAGGRDIDRDIGKPATIGAATGGVAGLLVGVGVFTIPGIGPMVAIGPILTTLAGAGLGALAGGLIGALTSSGVPDEEAGIYAEGVRRGGTLLMLRSPDQDAERAADIMGREGALDVTKRAEHWRSQGFTGFDPNAKALTAEEIGQDRRTIPIVQEELEVGKRTVQTGGVRVFAHVTERPETLEVELREEHVEVTRRPVDRPATQAELGQMKDQTIEVAEHAERPVAAKTARVVEEVVVGKNVEARTERVSDTVRRTDVDVRNTGGGQTGGKSTGRWATFSKDFRSDFDRNYATSGGRWDEYEPAYRYGIGLHEEPRYASRDWSSIEPDVRRDWESRQPGTWDRMKNAVRHAFDRARSSMSSGPTRHT